MKKTGLVLGLMLAVALWTAFWAPKKATVPAPEMVTSKRSAEEINRFLQQKILPVVVTKLEIPNWPTPEVGAHYHSLADNIAKRWGTRTLIIPITDYLQQNRLRFAQSQAPGNNPQVLLSIQSYMDLEDNLRVEGGRWQECFDLELVKGLMHELEHLDDDNLRIPKSQVTNDESMREESRAWANTCVYVIVPLIKAEKTMTKDSWLWYQQWLGCGQKNNECWEQNIRRIYAPK